jgi:hypothetical protein
MPERTTHLTKTVVEQVPKVVRLESIKSRIVGLALLATLIHSLGMAWISYAQNRAALTDKIAEELQGVSAQTALERRTAAGVPPAGARLSEYLTSVEERFPDYEELIVIDREGQTSADGPGELNFSPDWLERVAADEVVIADAY